MPPYRAPPANVSDSDEDCYGSDPGSVAASARGDAASVSSYAPSIFDYEGAMTTSSSAPTSIPRPRPRPALNPSMHDNTPPLLLGLPDAERDGEHDEEHYHLHNRHHRHRHRHDGRNQGQRFLWCEYRTITGCRKEYPLDQKENWIAHHHGHLQGRAGVQDVDYPARLMCWFCDDFPFDVVDDVSGFANFQIRMDHVRDHILQDPWATVDHVQTDLFMVDHLRSAGLITPQQYDTVRHSRVPRALRIPGTPGSVLFTAPRSTVYLRDEEIVMRPYNEREEKRKLKQRLQGLPNRR